jgi:hypothetical protein
MPIDGGVMFFSKLYSALQDSRKDDAVVMIVTGQNRVIELYIFCRLIIGFKSRLLSHADILETLTQDNIKELAVSERKPSLEQTEPSAIVDTITLTAPFALANETLPRRLGCLISLMYHLSLKDDDKFRYALEALKLELTKVRPNFTVDSNEISIRSIKLRQELVINSALLQMNPDVNGYQQTISWITGIYNAIEDILMRDTVISALVLGERSTDFQNIIVDRASGLGSKPGVGRLAKKIYPQYMKYSGATLYRGLERLGNIRIDWHSEKRDVFYMTKPDLENFGINRAEKINLIFTA